VPADAGVQGCARGREGVSTHPPGARGVRRVYSWDSRRRVEAGSCEDAMGAQACSRDRTHPARVLRGERRPRRARRKHARRRFHLECGNAFFFGGGKGVCESPATVMRRDPRCSRDRGGRERQRRGASAPSRRRSWWHHIVDGAAGRPGHRCMCAAEQPPPPALPSSGGAAG
jgi:hypothetical protein